MTRAPHDVAWPIAIKSVTPRLSFHCYIKTTPRHNNRRRSKTCEIRARGSNSPEEEPGRGNRARSPTTRSLLPHLRQITAMTTSRRLADRKVERFEKNIMKRGAVPETTAKKGKDYAVGPILLGFFIFVVIGSSLFQIIRTATSGGMA